MVEGSGLENRQAFARLEGSNPSLSANQPSGEMAERLKAHAWKACVGKPTVGSNPTLSASFPPRAGSLGSAPLAGRLRAPPWKRP